MPGYNRVEGDFGHLVIPSFTDWLDRNPALKWGAIAGGAAALATLAAQVFEGQST